ncbi:MAG: ATP-binding cassette domain-containing protein [Bacilli bacterium]|nr:ATP-binding cassette domain-containing protein [Bacilli bacterium]
MIGGNNGAGKTTLLRCMSSLELPDTGNIIYNTILIHDKKNILEYRKHVSLLLETSKSLISNLTILQNVKFFLGINNIVFKEVEEELFKMLFEFELVPYADKTINRLSKGMKQKVALIIALLKKRDIVLMDEPYDGLDMKAIGYLQELLEEISKEKIVVIASPNEMWINKAKKVVL